MMNEDPEKAHERKRMEASLSNFKTHLPKLERCSRA